MGETIEQSRGRILGGNGGERGTEMREFVCMSINQTKVYVKVCIETYY